MADIDEQSASMQDDLDNEPKADGSPGGPNPMASRTLLAALGASGVGILMMMLASMSPAMAFLTWVFGLVSLAATGFVAWSIISGKGSVSSESSINSAQMDAMADQLENHLKIVASGELTHPAPTGTGAWGRIANRLDATFKAIADHLDEARAVAARVEDNATDAAGAINSLIEQRQQQSSTMEKMFLAISDIDEGLNWVAANSSKVGALTAPILDMSQKGASAIAEMSGQMEQIRSHSVEAGTRVARLEGFSAEMKSMIELLARVADQASVLALQAALQSEKAGPAGQGFRIVSESMKTLAGEIEALARRGSSIAIAASSDVEASSQSIEQAIMGTDDVARLMDVANEAAQHSSDNKDDIQSMLEHIEARSQGVLEQVRSLPSRLPEGGTIEATEAVSLVASVRELAHKLGRVEQ